MKIIATNAFGVALEPFEETTNQDPDCPGLVKSKRILITQIHIFRSDNGGAASEGTGAA